MADNLPVTPGAGANLAMDEILGVKYGRSKMVLGADGVNDGDVGIDNPIPLANELAIARGVVTNHSSVHKFGKNITVGTTKEYIWSPGGVYPWPAAAETIRVRAGGNAADDASGVGARTITVEGLDGSLNVVTETLTLAGASASAASTNSFLRVYRAFVATCGTRHAANTGNILIENTTTNDLLAQIDADRGQTQMMVYTVPLGYNAYVTGVDLHVEQTKAVSLRLMQKQGALETSAPFSSNRVVLEWTDIIDGHAEESVLGPFPAGTDLWIEGETKSSTASVHAHMDIVLVQ